VRQVSFEVAGGSLTALIGPNGAGKSTLYNLVTNLYRPDEGDVYLHGRRITGVAPERVTALGLFRTFQTARIFPQLTVLENVLVGGYRLGRAGYLAQSLWLPRCRREESDLQLRARRLLEVMGLADRAATRASVLILAEPGAGMTAAATAALGMILRAIRDNGHTLLVVEHNMSLVMGVCDRVVVMDAGRIIASGSPEEVQRDPEVIGAYFGAAEASA
jgi:branched-chain amino acid transport system ATP-binding protein